METEVCRRIKISGTVQGVGFRPFVYNLARSRGLRGEVSNTGEGVLIEIEGKSEQVESFISELQANPPALARLTGCLVESGKPRGYLGFRITGSCGEAGGDMLLPPDVAVCPRCREELHDPRDRHYRYPFTNCTACGPRFTVVSGLPYDRARTSMAGFPMCSDCAREYNDPRDRRFHAQPVACPACGPRVELVDRSGSPLAGDWLEESLKLLARGKILAVKSLGGFHLACDAANPRAVAELRRRKGRPAKPLAVMCRDLATAREHCRISPEEEALLSSPGAPIVVLARRPGSALPEGLAPGLNSLGVMLPYTPLHLLLFSGCLAVLVMTSGNLSRLPLAVANRQALEELGGIADYFLLHDREIFNRCDDSVVAVIGGESHFFRRSRGCVPAPVAVPVPVAAPVGREAVVLGAGGEMKNTFCLLKGERAYLSQHLGDMDLLEGQQNFKESLAGFCRLVRAEPEVVAWDLHPGYQISRLAIALPARFGTGVQHHHAHMAACMAENGLEGEVVGIILDGTGYGAGGRLWGFEVLRGDYLHFSREAHLAYTPLPGGERAVKNPWLSAVSYLVTFLGERGWKAVSRLFPERAGEMRLVERMLASGLNSPPASSCGRLFDAVSAILGVCRESTYEGQAAIELGELVAWHPAPGEKMNPYRFELRAGVFSPARLLAGILGDCGRGAPPAEVARRFHDTVAAMAAAGADLVRARTGLNRVVLSGGCWHNRYLLEAAREVLRTKGFEVFYHRLVPPGDGGISLGQALVARRRWNKLPNA